MHLLNTGLLIAQLVLSLGIICHVLFRKAPFRPWGIPDWLIRSVWILLACSATLWAYLAYFIWGAWTRDREPRPQLQNAITLCLLVLATVMSAMHWTYTKQEVPYTFSPMSYEKHESGWLPELPDAVQSLPVILQTEHLMKPPDPSLQHVYGHKMFPIRHMVFLIPEPSLFLDAIATELIREFQTLPEVQSIHVIETETAYPDSHHLPDLVVTLNLDEWSEDVGHFSSTFGYRLIYLLTNTWLIEYPGHWNRPVFHTYTQSRLETRNGIVTGFYSPDEAIRLFGQKVAREAIPELFHHLKATGELHPTNYELLDRLTPAFSRPDTFPVAWMNENAPFMEGQWPLTRYVGIWEIPDKDAFLSIRQQMIEAGWPDWFNAWDRHENVQYKHWMDGQAISIHEKPGMRQQWSSIFPVYLTFEINPPVEELLELPYRENPDALNLLLAQREWWDRDRDFRDPFETWMHAVEEATYYQWDAFRTLVRSTDRDGNTSEEYLHFLDRMRESIPNKNFAPDVYHYLSEATLWHNHSESYIRAGDAEFFDAINLDTTTSPHTVRADMYEPVLIYKPRNERGGFVILFWNQYWHNNPDDERVDLESMAFASGSSGWSGGGSGTGSIFGGNEISEYTYTLDNQFEMNFTVERVDHDTHEFTFTWEQE